MLKKVTMVRPLFSFGLITDVQYADCDDAMNYTRTRWRYYRKALVCLKNAISHWNEEEDTSFILQLGDLIDGCCRRSGKRDANFRQLSDIIQRYQNPIAHCWGNHELYNFSKKELMTTDLYPEMFFQEKVSQGTNLMQFYSLKTLKEHQIGCYHFSPHPGFRLIVLDCYDISVLGRDKDHPKYILANEVLDKMNPSEDKNDHRFAMDPKYVGYNGGLSEEQLLWLKEVLMVADTCGEKVILCGHIPIDPKATGNGQCVVWNNEEILNLCKEHQCVVAYFAGHDHEGASYHCDKNGVHQYTFESVLEAVPKHLGGNETAFATVDVFLDRMEVRGTGDITSRTLTFRS